MKVIILNGKALLVPQNQYDKRNIAEKQRKFDERLRSVNLGKVLSELADKENKPVVLAKRGAKICHDEGCHGGELWGLCTCSTQPG